MRRRFIDFNRRNEVSVKQRWTIQKALVNWSARIQVQPALWTIIVVTLISVLDTVYRLIRAIEKVKDIDQHHYERQVQQQIELDVWHQLQTYRVKVKRSKQIPPNHIHQRAQANRMIKQKKFKTNWTFLLLLLLLCKSFSLCFVLLIVVNLHIFYSSLSSFLI